MIHAAKVRNVGALLLATLMIIFSLAPSGYAKRRLYRHVHDGRVYYTYSPYETHHHSRKKGALVGGAIGAIGGALIGGGKGAVIGATSITITTSNQRADRPRGRTGTRGRFAGRLALLCRES